MYGVRRILVFSCIVAVCIGLFSGIVSVRSLFVEKKEVISLPFYIRDYKITEDLVELFTAGDDNVFYVDDINRHQFDREKFQGTFSEEKQYKLVVDKLDYNNLKTGEKCVLYGVEDESTVFLDAYEVQKTQDMNAVLGLVVSGMMFLSAILLFNVIRGEKYYAWIETKTNEGIMK